MNKEVKGIAKRTRWYRKLHKWVAIPLMYALLIIAFSGILLGWKKQTNLLPPTQTGTSLNSDDWLSISNLKVKAQTYISENLNIDDDIARIDIRPSKGIAKITFKQHFTELQIDCTTGQILSKKQRNSDIIEKIHDGSIIDYLLGANVSFFKLSYTTLSALGLLVLCFSGFWLWYNPKRIKQKKTDSSGT